MCKDMAVLLAGDAHQHVTGRPAPARKFVLHCAKVRRDGARRHFLAQRDVAWKFTIYSTA
jgi:hypothetical protein